MRCPPALSLLNKMTANLLLANTCHITSYCRPEKQHTRITNDSPCLTMQNATNLLVTSPETTAQATKQALSQSYTRVMQTASSLPQLAPHPFPDRKFVDCIMTACYRGVDIVYWSPQYYRVYPGPRPLNMLFTSRLTLTTILWEFRLDPSFNLHFLPSLAVLWAHSQRNTRQTSVASSMIFPGLQASLSMTSST